MTLWNKAKNSIIQAKNKIPIWFKKTGTKRVLSNFTWLTTLQVVEKIVPLITIPYLLRTIGIEKWGLVTFAMSFIQYFATFVDYGFNVTGVREVSLNQDNKNILNTIFSTIMSVKLIFTVISFLFFLLLVIFIHKFSQEKLVFIFTFGLVIGQALFPLWFFQGMEKMKFSTILSSIAKLIFLILIFVFIKNEKDYVLVPLLNSLGIIVSGIIGLVIVFNIFKIKFNLPEFNSLIKAIKDGGKVFISNLFISFYTNTRVFALGLFSNNTIVGYYGIAEKIAFYLGMPFGLFAQAMYPRLANLYGNSKERFLKLIKYLNILAFFVGIFILILGLLFSQLIVYFLTGKPISVETQFSLIFLLLGASFVQANTFRIQYFLARGDYNSYKNIHIFGGLFGIVIIFILSYLFGYKGTAISVAVIEGMILLIAFYFFKKGEKK